MALEHELVELERRLSQGATDPAILFRRLQLLSDLGRHPEAIAAGEQLVTRFPKAPEAWSEFGFAFLAWNRAEAAELALRTARSLAPSDPEHAYNHAIALQSLWRLSDAEALLQEIVRVRPDHDRAWSNLAWVLGWLGRYEDELVAADHAVRLDPRNPERRFARAMCLLRQGRWEEGWNDYESRYALFPTPALARTWNGERVPGTLVVAAEQGLGDTFQFLRYLAVARARVGRLVLACHPPLVPFLSAQAIADEVVGLDRIPPGDASIRLMSLPLALGRQDPSVDAVTPWLRADETRISRWRARLRTDERPLIALTWKGGQAYAADRFRSFTLSALGPLLNGTHARFVSVQFGAQAEELARHPMVEDLCAAGLDHDGAFLDTAAVLACADVVVTSDTSTAHLSAALGARTFIALGHVADWRWGVGGDRSVWSPDVTLFRKRTIDDISGPFEAMVRRLRSVGD